GYTTFYVSIPPLPPCPPFPYTTLFRSADTRQELLHVGSPLQLEGEFTHFREQFAPTTASLNPKNALLVLRFVVNLFKPNCNQGYRLCQALLVQLAISAKFVETC